MITPEIMRQMVGMPAHHQALGIRYVDHGPDWMLLELPFADHLVGYPEIGVVAGGAVFTLMDAASGFAVLAGAGWSANATLDLRIDYLKPVPPFQTLRARGHVHRRTRTIVFTRAIAYLDDPDQPLAQATGTFILGAV